MSTDALSDVLSAVQLSGSVFFDVTAKSPWVAEAPRCCTDCQRGHARRSARNRVSRRHPRHVLDIARRRWRVRAGQARGRRHRRYPAGRPPRGVERAGHARRAQFGNPPPAGRRQRVAFAIQTGGGDGTSETHLICGFFSCDARPFNPLLDALPRFMRFSRDTSPGSHSLLDQFIRFATAETENKRAGSQSVLNRLSELMFVEVIRIHMDQLANNNTGWLAGLRDPLVGRGSDAVACAACARLDARGARFGSRCLTLGAGRSLYPNRGLSADPVPGPMAMQIAAKRLADPNVKIAAVAHEVGYESEAAFSRAFKKFVGRSPSQWRTGSN